MSYQNPGAVTQLLFAAQDGDRTALDQLFPLIYDELRLLARRHLAKERKDHTIDSVALVNEIYVKLVGKSEISAKSRGQFFALASTAMRLFLVDYARGKQRKKRGSGHQLIRFNDELDFMDTEKTEFVLALDEALKQLSDINEEAAKVVEMRFFGGLKLREIAGIMNLSFITVRRRWEFARAWLFQALQPEQ